MRLSSVSDMNDQASLRYVDRARDVVWFCAIALVCIVIGGLVAAVTSPLGLKHGSWAAAYLVLVGGVAQGGLGIGQHVLTQRRPALRVVGIELATWNAGGLAVIGGTVVSNPWIVDLGGLLLAAALLCMIWLTRGSTAGPRWLAWGYRILLAVIIISIPIGLTMAHLRSV